MNVNGLFLFFFDFALDLHPASQWKQGGSHAFLRKRPKSQSSQSSLQPKDAEMGTFGFLPHAQKPQVIIRAPKGNDNLRAVRVLRYRVHCTASTLPKGPHRVWFGIIVASHRPQRSESFHDLEGFAVFLCQRPKPNQIYPNSPTEGAHGHSQPPASSSPSSHSTLPSCRQAGPRPRSDSATRPVAGTNELATLPSRPGPSLSLCAKSACARFRCLLFVPSGGSK